MGIGKVFGVPGDYNLGFLDQVVDSELDWVGSCNELNAAYAADGYARLAGAGAVITTFGVGELSAINGIAGSYAESVPVVKITGAPALAVEIEGLRVHHSLGDGDFNHFNRIYDEVTVGNTTLRPANATAEIDRVLRACWEHKRPVHITLPTDVVEHEVDEPGDALNPPLPAATDQVRKAFAQHAALFLDHARRVTVLADVGADRHGARAALANLIAAGDLPAATMAMGKGVIDETTPSFVGTYVGRLSEPGTREMVEDADCLIAVGLAITDTNTGGFSHRLDYSRMIEIHPTFARIGYANHGPMHMTEALEILAGLVADRRGQFERAPSGESVATSAGTGGTGDGPIRHEHFWNRIQGILADGDILVAEQGTAFAGSAALRLPRGGAFITQVLWGSVGFTVPAALGAQLAAPQRRVTLAVGDGSFQFTAQELSTFLRHRLAPTIFLINNDGYTVERLIHGMTAPYNDIAPWRYAALPAVLGDADRSVSIRVETMSELDDALTQAQRNRDKLTFVEVVMPCDDAPQALKELSAAFAAQNAYGSTLIPA
jgi:indolepyruvate decarboxylase